MARSHEKRALDAGQAQSLTDFAGSPSLSATKLKRPRTVQFTLPNRSLGKNRLSFEFGANIVFKVLYATYILQKKCAYTIDEQVSIIYDASNILLEAQEIFNDHKDEIIEERDIQALRTSLEALNHDGDLEDGVKSRLRSLQEKPLWVLNNLTLEEWHNDALAFLKHSKAVKNKFDIEYDLHVTRERVGKIYNECVKIVEERSLIVDSTAHSTRDSTDPNHTRHIHTILGFMGQEDEPSPESVNHRFEKIWKVYEAFYDIMRGNVLVDNGCFNLEDLANACHVVGDELLYLLGQFGQEASLKDQYLQRTADVFCQGFCHALIARSQDVVSSTLDNLFQDLHQLLTTQPGLHLENDFSRLAYAASALSMVTPVGVDENEWTKYASRMLNSTQSQIFMNNLQFLYKAFQDQVYTSTERTRLWLKIWRGLKATYLIVRALNFQLEQPGFPVETVFFNRTTIRNQFEKVLSGPEPLHTEIVENIVAEYCILIAECQRSANLKYGMLKQLRTTEVQSSILQIIDEYAESREWNDIAIRGIEKCAVRLNYILDGPAFMRRLERPGWSAIPGFVPEWSVQNVTLKSDRPLSTRSHSSTASKKSSRQRSSAGISTASGSFSAREDNETVPERSATFNPFETHARHHLPDIADSVDEILDEGLARMNVVSAFDYVAYPFPETRAIEVAQSRQISREMSQSGIYSEGALSEDVINRPPRHAWPPGAVSIWAKPLPLDPVSVLNAVWSHWRHGRSERKAHKRPKPFPSLTPRRPRREWVDEHPRLKPLFDQKTRVTKAKSDSKLDKAHHEHHEADLGPTHIPKLRGGGGGRPSDAAEGASIRQPDAPGPVTSPIAQLSPSEMNARTQQLMHRLQGFWRGGDLPPVHMVRDHFLIPNDWDVDTAHDAARRFIDYGVLDHSLLSDPGHDQDDDQISSSFSVNRPQPPNGQLDDPFIDLGVNPGTGLDPRIYGIPTYREPVTPDGQYGYRQTQTSPTPSSRRGLRMIARQALRLDPSLQAHLRPLPNPTLRPSWPGSSNAATATATATAMASASAPSPSSGLPFQIWEDSPDRRTPVPAADLGGVLASRAPAPNQQHQAQIDRQGGRSSSSNSSNYVSNQENITPPRRRPARPQRTPSESGPSHSPHSPHGPRCSNRCHPCPEYSGLFHHICNSDLRQPHGVEVETLAAQPSGPTLTQPPLPDGILIPTPSRQRPGGSVPQSTFPSQPSLVNGVGGPSLEEGNHNPGQVPQAASLTRLTTERGREQRHARRSAQILPNSTMLMDSGADPDVDLDADIDADSSVVSSSQPRINQIFRATNSSRGRGLAQSLPKASSLDELGTSPDVVQQDTTDAASAAATAIQNAINQLNASTAAANARANSLLSNLGPCAAVASTSNLGGLPLPAPAVAQNATTPRGRPRGRPRGSRARAGRGGRGRGSSTTTPASSPMTRGRVTRARAGGRGKGRGRGSVAFTAAAAGTNTPASAPRTNAPSGVTTRSQARASTV